MRKRFGKGALVLALVAALQGCNGEVAIEDGKVPLKFLEQARSWTGVYQGSVGKYFCSPSGFEKGCRLKEAEIPATLTVTLVDGKPLLKIDPSFTGKACDGEVGDLQRAFGAEKQEGNPDSVELRELYFELHRKGCRPFAEYSGVLQVYPSLLPDGRLKIQTVNVVNHRRRSNAGDRWIGTFIKN